MGSYKINLFLLFLACIAVAFLIKYTDVAETGVAGNLVTGIENLKRIVNDPVPKSELSATEKEGLKKILQKSDRQSSLFCQSSYFPYFAGAKWRYRLTSGSGDDTVEIGVPSGENGLVYLDGRLLSREKWTARSIIKCVEGRIKITDLNFLSVFNQDRIVTTPCEDGQFNFYLPRDSELVKDKAWTESGCLVREQLDQNYREKESETRENIIVNWKVLGSEKINVPAGEFMADKLELTYPNQLTDIWIVLGVGIVKTIYREPGVNNPTVTQELIEYQIPTEREYKNRTK